jgi:D-amino peptidase
VKAFISIDMEGLPHIVSREHLLPGRSLYQEARVIMTECLLASLEALQEAGVEKAIVADSHGPMVNVLPERLPIFAELVRGYPRSESMLACSEGSDFALFLGYHAKAGAARAVFDHVYSGATIRGVWVNGREASEFLLNAAVLGERGIPVALVAGDAALIREDVAQWAPWAVALIMKEGLGRYAALSPSMARVLEQLRQGTKEAVNRYKAGMTSPIKLQSPITMEIAFASTAYAQIASHLPQARLTNGTTIRFQADSASEAYRIMELLAMAAHGVRSIAEA